MGLRRRCKWEGSLAGSGCFGEPQAEGSDIGRGGREGLPHWNQQCIGSGKGAVVGSASETRL